MSVNSKHMATFLLGAAAAFGAYKYSKLSDEEKEKLIATLKEKAHNLKDQAEGTVDKAKDYFSELTTKGGEALKEHFPGMEDFINKFFKKETQSGTSTNESMSSTQPPTP
jgi:hypothetical protein